MPPIGLRALGDHDDRRRTGSRSARPTQLADRVDVEVALRDQDHVGAAGEPGVERRSSRRGGPSPRRPAPGGGSRRWCGGGRSPPSRCRPRCRSRRCSRSRRGRCRSSSGTPTTLQAVLVRAATRRRGCPRRRSRSAPSTPAASRFAAIRSGPSSGLKGLVREEPRMVPPRGRMPRTSGTPSGRRSSSSGPRQPSR